MAYMDPMGYISIYARCNHDSTHKLTSTAQIQRFIVFIEARPGYTGPCSALNVNLLGDVQGSDGRPGVWAIAGGVLNMLWMVAKPCAS